MAKKKSPSALVVWMNGERVGTWSVKAGARHELAYADTWLESPRTRPLSLSMPLRHEDPYRGALVRNFFENLLPENDRIRERIQARYSTASGEAFDLLAEIGRDCVGAIQLLPDGKEPVDVHRITAEPLDDAEIERVLNAVPVSALHDDDADFRVSLAGAQEKTAFVMNEGRWCKPIGSTPTTHIFKLPLGITPAGVDLRTTVENEWLCSLVLKEYGSPIANCVPGQFGEVRVLIVERFDRRLSSDRSWWIRLPQEDLAQAMGVAPAAKYESEGGPGIASIMDLLMGGTQPEQDRIDFFRTQVLFWILCAIDGHAKNFSIFLAPLGRYRLTPRYDVLSAYPMLGHARGQLAPEKVKMAMAVAGKNRHYRWAEIRRRHFEEMARRCGLGDQFGQIVQNIIEATPAVVANVQRALPPRFPGHVSDPIVQGITDAVRRLEAGT